MERTVKSQTEISQPVFAILGAGFTAQPLIKHLIACGFDVVATKRTSDNFNTLAALGARPLIYDATPSDALLKELKSATHLLSSVPQGAMGDPFLKALNKSPRKIMPNLKWAGYLSATSVYGDRGGEWVTEDDKLYPITQRGKDRAQAELAWIESGLPIHIFRLAGIYGLGRTPFEKIRRGHARAVIKEGHIVNRIHLDDIIQAILLSIARPDPLSLYNLADDLPAPPQDVLDFAADLMGLSPPKRVRVESPEVSKMARSFYGETKRISNALIKSKLGWSPTYPTYKTGLMSLLKAERGQKDAVILCGRLEVPTGDLIRVMRALPTHVRLSNQELGCRRFHIRQNKNLPTQFFVSEIFDSPKSFHQHQMRIKGTEWAIATQNCSRDYDIIGL